MPSRSWLSSFQRGQIVALYRHAHWPIQRIADTLSISKSTVYRIALQSEHSDPVTPPKPKGRPRVCTRQRTQRFIRFITANAEARRLRIDQAATLAGGMPYHLHTLQAALHREGYHRRIARKKPLLTEAHKAARLQWAQEHVNWSDRQWQRVLWTDEASIRCGYFGQIYVTRRADEAFAEDCLVARFRKYSACMIWGCIGSDGPKQCFVFDQGSINGEVYRSQVVPLISSIAQQHQRDSLFQQSAVVMQDNASIHKAIATLELFKQLDIELLCWPANSPDLNPIENIWCLLKHRIGRHFPTTKETVMAAIRLEWSQLTSSDISRACQSMRERCQAVIDANGGHTRW